MSSGGSVESSKDLNSPSHMPNSPAMDGSSTESEEDKSQSDEPVYAWELPPPRFGPFEKVTFQQLEAAYQKVNHQSGQTDLP